MTRAEIELAVMEYLNDNPSLFYAHCYDCGPDGILYIWFSQTGWEREWFKPEPLPAEVEDELDANS